MLFLVGCENNKNELEEVDTTPRLEIFYSIDNTSSDKYSVMHNDTIAVNLGDTLSLYITEYYISRFIGVFGDSGVEITGNEDKEYMCVAVNSGVSSVGLYADTEGEGYLDVIFFINISSYKYYFNIISDPVVTIDTEDVTIKSLIQAQLKENMMPVINTSYRLECNAIDGGELLYVTASEGFWGTFTTSRIDPITDMTLYYNNLEYSFIIEKIDSDELENAYWLKQDLTSVFQDKYSNVNEVTVKTKSLKTTSK